MSEEIGKEVKVYAPEKKVGDEVEMSIGNSRLIVNIGKVIALLSAGFVIVKIIA